MLTIDLEPELELSLNALAKEQHISANELVKQFIEQCMQKKQHSHLLIDMLNDLPEFPSFAGKEPLVMQQEWRNEWD
jgi:hypothetical protein